MLVTRGLGRDGSAGGPLVTVGMGRYLVVIEDGNIRATLSGSSTLHVSAKALASIEATLNGYGSIAAYLENNTVVRGTYVQFDGLWYLVQDIYAYTGGSWIRSSELFSNQGGTWTRVWG